VRFRVVKLRASRNQPRPALVTVLGEELAQLGVDGWAGRAEWGSVFPDPRLLAAIVDRITFNAHILETGTDSYRLRTSKTSSRRKRAG
jgi:hypothetical protein